MANRESYGTCSRQCVVTAPGVVVEIGLQSRMPPGSPEYYYGLMQPGPEAPPRSRFRTMVGTEERDKNAIGQAAPLRRRKIDVLVRCLVSAKTWVLVLSGLMRPVQAKGEAIAPCHPQSPPCKLSTFLTAIRLALSPFMRPT